MLTATYAKPTHPETEKRNMCWIKASNQLAEVANQFYTSGIVE